MFDPVQKPSHYTEGRNHEPIDVIEDWDLGYHAGCALKYIARAGRKDPSLTRQDLQKAVWYLERLIDGLSEEAAQVQDAETMIKRRAEDLPTIDQEEIEFRAMADLGTVNFGVDEPAPFSVTHEDLLEFEAYETGNVEPISKDLSKFSDQDIIRTTIVDGAILGHQKNGDVQVLGSRPPGDLW